MKESTAAAAETKKHGSMTLVTDKKIKAGRWRTLCIAPTTESYRYEQINLVPVVLLVLCLAFFPSLYYHDRGFFNLERERNIIIFFFSYAVYSFELFLFSWLRFVLSTLFTFQCPPVSWLVNGPYRLGWLASRCRGPVWLCHYARLMDWTKEKCTAEESAFLVPHSLSRGLLPRDCYCRTISEKTIAIRVVQLHWHTKGNKAPQINTCHGRPCTCNPLKAALQIKQANQEYSEEEAIESF